MGRLKIDAPRGAVPGDNGSEDEPKDSTRTRFQPRLVRGADDEESVAVNDSDEERVAGSSFAAQSKCRFRLRDSQFAQCASLLGQFDADHVRFRC